MTSQQQEQELRDKLRDHLRASAKRTVDDLKDQLRNDTRRMLADAAPIAPQDDQGVFTITTLAPQEHP